MGKILPYDLMLSFIIRYRSILSFMEFYEEVFFIDPYIAML